MKKAVAYLIPFIEQEKLDNPELATAKDTNGTIVMATVKGDVHDIGKNIVGVVLQCNNYEVIDLGVMVPAQKILDTAREIGADVIGLSGLITPSLDEMVNLASEMQRQEFTIPLLIGGATTSRAHTAVKIDQKYAGPVVWVKDASRSVPITAQLLSDDRRQSLLDDVQADFDSLRARHAAKSDRPMVKLEQARERATPVDWSTYRPRRPHLLLQQDHAVSTDLRRGQAGDGDTQHVRVFRNYDLADLRKYIDWQPFFNAWEMKGSFPDILNNPTTSEAARKLYDDAQVMLDRIIDERWLSANGVVGLFPANAVGDDVEVYLDESRQTPHVVLHQLRQQGQHRDGVPNRSLADFVAPKETGLKDYVGAFAVTAGLGASDRVEAFRKELDDYSGDPARGAGRPAGRGVRRAAARAGAPRAVGLRARRAARQRRPDQGEVRRDPPGARVPRQPGPHREADDLDPARRRGRHRHDAHRVDGDAARGVGVRPLLRPPGLAVLRRRPHRPRPGRGLRRPQGLDARRGRAVALAEPRLRPR